MIVKWYAAERKACFIAPDRDIEQSSLEPTGLLVSWQLAVGTCRSSVQCVRLSCCQRGPGETNSRTEYVYLGHNYVDHWIDIKVS